ncbi:MAG TPA: ADOP family duplicated permease [Acidobacteriota bacterium]
MLARWLIRLRAFLRGRRVDSEFDEELGYHLEQQIRLNRELGMSREDARCAALRELGNPLQLRDEARETWRWRRLDELGHDIRYAVRALRDHPGFSAVAILSLGFGIGATTTLFSVIDALDFRPPPFHQPERLVFLAELWPETEPDCPRCPGRTWAATANEWRTRTSSFEAFGIQNDSYLCLEDAGVGDCPDVGYASPGFFGVLGVRPALGREFLPEDALPGAAAVVVLSHDTWKGRFHGDPTVIGRRFEYAEDSTFSTRQSSTIVGVLPEGFRFRRDNPFWMPLTDDSGRRDTTVVARLKPGIAPAAADAELSAVHRGLVAARPDAYKGPDAAVRPLREALQWRRGEGRGTLFAIATIVLLIAVLNVAGMFTARAAARHRELTVRRALGASGARLVRQLLVEGGTLGLAGGLLGVTMATWGVGFASLSFGMERNGPPAQLDHRVLAFATGLSIIAGLLAALLPAVGVGRTDLYSALREPAASGRKERAGWTPRVLLVGQIAAGLILLSAAGLLGSEYLKLRYLDVGYDPVNVYEARLNWPYREEPELMRPEAERARAMIERIPGVVSASLRYISGSRPAIIRAEGLFPGGEEELSAPVVNRVDADYFETLGIRIVAGRSFSEDDDRSAPLVAIVNRAAASAYLPGRSALGQRLFLGDSASAGEWVTVVGVVEDVERGEYVRRHLPRLYRPLAQSRLYHPYITVDFKVAESHPEVLGMVQSALREALGSPIRPVTSHEGELADKFLSQRINAVALNLFAAFALLLAGVGIYGNVAYAVTRRTREIGIRVALGAERGNVLALLARSGIAIAFAGVTLGCLGSLALTRIMQSFVSTTSVTDPWVLGGAAFLMASAVLVATYLPARRATAVDPTVALRDQ